MRPRLLFRWVVPLLLMACPAAAETRYTFAPPSCPPQICGSGWRVYIDGEIRADEGAILEREITARGIGPYTTIILNSPGGALVGGMALGRVIRKYGFNTSVGSPPAPGADYGSDGGCYSACTFAFMGGRLRYFDDGSTFGVHRFYSRTPPADAEASAQIASAAIISYLDEVGIPAAFFVEMTRAAADEIRTLTAAQLVEMGVVTNGIGPTSWEIQTDTAAPGQTTLYLRGTRETRYGVQKALFFCDPSGKHMVLYVIFDPQGRAKEVMAMGVITLVVDGRTFPLQPLRKGRTEVVNGWINAAFDLPGQYWQAIKSGASLGVTFQFSPEAPVFFGFVGLPLQEARPLLDGIATTCPGAYAP